METREARGGSRRHVVAFAVLALALITAPIALGLQMAEAGAVDVDTVSAPSATTVPGTPTTAPSGTLPEAVAGGGGQEPITVEDALTRLSDDEINSRLRWMRDDGIEVVILNGDTIALGNGYEVAVTVEPYPLVNFDPADVAFTLTRDGRPVTDATLTATYDMLYMKHGPFPLAMTAAADGTYRGPEYYFFMFGPWGITTTVQAPGADPMTFTISILVWPS